MTFALPVLAAVLAVSGTAGFVRRVLRRHAHKPGSTTDRSMLVAAAFAFWAAVVKVHAFIDLVS